MAQLKDFIDEVCSLLFINRFAQAWNVRSGVAQPCSGSYRPLRIESVADKLDAQLFSLSRGLRLSILLHELLNTAFRIHNLLSPREERMARGTDFKSDLRNG
jgi:hypothetical protein